MIKIRKSNLYTHFFYQEHPLKRRKRVYSTHVKIITSRTFKTTLSTAPLAIVVLPTFVYGMPNNTSAYTVQNNIKQAITTAVYAVHI